MTEVGGRFWRKAYTAAWQEAFGVVAGVMMEGAREQAAIAA